MPTYPIEFIGGPLDGATRDIEKPLPELRLQNIRLADWKYYFCPNRKEDVVLQGTEFTLAGEHAYMLDGDRYHYRGVTR